MNSTSVKPSIISKGTSPESIGACCCCDAYSRPDNDADLNNFEKWKLTTHIEHSTLYLCPGCDDYACKEHLQACGLCYGCCAEEHGLNSDGSCRDKP